MGNNWLPRFVTPENAVVMPDDIWEFGKRVEGENNTFWYAVYRDQAGKFISREVTSARPDRPSPYRYQIGDKQVIFENDLAMFGNRPMRITIDETTGTWVVYAIDEGYECDLFAVCKNLVFTGILKYEATS
jgi:hypothetical protein